MTLDELVREQIGAEGPQLEVKDYHMRIEDVLSRMSPSELLTRISDALDALGFEIREKNDGL